MNRALNWLMAWLLLATTGCAVGRSSFEMSSSSRMPWFNFELAPRETKDTSYKTIQLEPAQRARIQRLSHDARPRATESDRSRQSSAPISLERTPRRRESTSSRTAARDEAATKSRSAAPTGVVFVLPRTDLELAGDQQETVRDRYSF